MDLSGEIALEAPGVLGSTGLGTKPVVVIPAYLPGVCLLELVRELSDSPGIGAVIVVDDGSGPAYSDLLRSLTRLEKVALLHHAINLGKGAALKTGLNHAAWSYPESVGVVTADADGQHSARDVVQVAAALSAAPRELVLGVRAFDAAVPLRSRLGNTLTRHIMRAVTGQKLTDTQTGLRGIPMDFVPVLLKLRAMGYDYELDMLVTCKSASRRIREVPISTIYIDGNRSSHFNPLLDSMRIYFVFVRFLAVSLSAAAIDNLVFAVASRLWPDILLCQVISRLVAGTFQFTAGKRGVFHSRVQNAVAAPKYWLLVLVSGTLSYMLIRNIVAITGIPVVSAKLCAEASLFFLSFVVQRDFVFSQK